MIEACVEAGIPRNDDVNGDEQEGVGYYQLTVKNGQRCSAAVAYLHPVMGRPNLRVETDALATRVLFEGKRAVGRRVRPGRRAASTAKAAREVILAGGAINSPQLLQLSGVGPADLLREHGIAVVADLPGVGENLQDHYVIAITYRLKPGTVSVNELTRGTRFLGETLKYVFQRKGLLTLSAAHIAVFCKSRPELASPDIQFHILPATMDTEKLMDEQKMELEGQPGLTIAPCQVRPESRGTIRIKSPNPTVYPAIQPNYLSDPLDQQVAVASLQWGRKIAAQPALAQVDRPRDAARAGRRRATRRCWPSPAWPARPSITRSAPARWAMGPQAVVDPQLRVHGRRGPARRRRLGDAAPGLRQHQRPHHHDRRKGRRHDPRQGAGQRPGGLKSDAPVAPRQDQSGQAGLHHGRAPARP